MSAPGSYPDWDTNATNTSAVTSGHASDGYAHNEIPTSDELNSWMMLVGLWIRWLATHDVVGWVWKFPFGAVSHNCTAPSISGLGVITDYTHMAASGSTDPAKLLVAFEVVEGTTINGVGVVVDNTGGALVSVAVSVISQAGVKTTLSGGYSGTPTAGWQKVTGSLTTPYTVAAGDGIYVEVWSSDPSSTGLTSDVRHVGLNRGFS